MHIERKSSTRLPPQEPSLPPSSAPSLPEADRTAGVRVVEIGGRKVKLVRVRREVGLRRPASADAKAPGAAQSGAQPTLATRHPQVPVFGLARVPQLLASELADQLQDSAITCWPTAVRDIAAFHDKGAGWPTAACARPPETWPPTEKFMSLVFAQILKPDFTDAAQAKIYTDSGLADRLLQELLEALLLPAEIVNDTAVLASLPTTDPRHDEGLTRRQELIDQNASRSIHHRVLETVHALLKSTRKTADENRVCTAMAQMMARAERQLDPGNYRCLARAVEAGRAGTSHWAIPPADPEKS